MSWSGVVVLSRWTLLRKLQCCLKSPTSLGRSREFRLQEQEVFPHVICALLA